MLIKQTQSRPGIRRLALVICATAAAVLGAGIGFAVAILSDGSPDYSAAVAARANNAEALGGLHGETGTASLADVVSGSQIEAAIKKTAWSDPDGGGNMRLENADPVGALSFDVGISYAEATTRLFMAAVAGGAPRGAKLVEPLSMGKVALIDASRNGQVTLDLRAPFGYRPDSRGGEILLPSVGFPPSVSAEDASSRPIRRFGRAGWPIGAHVIPMILPPCMRMASRTESSGACGVEDIALQDQSLLQGPPLP